MATRDDLIELEKKIMEDVVRRRKLGGYSVEAEGILFHSEVLLFLIQDLKDKAPRK